MIRTATGWGIALPGLVLLIGALTGCATGKSKGAVQSDLPVTCVVMPDPGSCRGNQVGFYYDYRDDRCKPFNSGGCQGRVPFPTLQRCVEFCGAKR